MSLEKEKMIVTCSLPYANGELHLGHILECVQADIWVRFQRMQHHHCYYICGSDCHGTPIMLRALQKKLSPQALVQRISAQHINDFNDFAISFDNFYHTHSPENQQLSQFIYQRLQENGDISCKTISQAYDNEKQMFLPDRLVTGECPRCHTPEQYGDNCECCGATYTPMELGHPKSVLSNTLPITKQSTHLFFELPRYQKALQQWLHTSKLQPQVINKLHEWFKQGLKPWDISRDAPYFGFEIPCYPGKYFYVWLDAPIGYMASFKNFCANRKDIHFDDFWQQASTTKLYHFIGKDVMYFHTLFWPAILMAAKLRTPTGVYVHGYLTVNGQKMSKSRQTFITARAYLDHFEPDYLRYYYAAKLNDSIEDIDFNIDDFQKRVNADLVGKVINIASRCAGFITTYFNNTLSNASPPSLWQSFIKASETVAFAYRQRQYAKAMRVIMALADDANYYISQQAPWKLIKTDKKKAHDICTIGINFFKTLMVYLKPVIPTVATRAATFLNVKDFSWQDQQTFLQNHLINKFHPLLTRISKEQINKMKNNNVAKEKTTPPQASSHSEITLDDFAKLDLRIAKVIAAKEVANADKLLQLTVEVAGIEKQIFAGIKSNYTPQDLIGRQVVIVANLAPRKMRFGISQAMILAAESEQGASLIGPDHTIPTGSLVK